MIMLQLESQSAINKIRPEAGISNPRGSDCSSRFSGFFEDCQMKKIPLTQGKCALVDDEDYEELSKHKWCATKTACGFVAVREKAGKRILMHRQIMSAPKSLDVDHKNHNTLDNRKENLRICSPSQNLANQRLRTGGTSKYKGVCWHKANKKWAACVRFKWENIHLGLFNDEIKAAQAYDRKAVELFGEFAWLNFGGSNHR